MKRALLRMNLACLAMAVIATGTSAFAAQRADQRATQGRHVHGDGNVCGMIPPNKQSYAVGLRTGISEQVFNQVIDQVEKVYAPIVQAQGGKLVIERRWKDNTVNAYAKRMGSTWHVAMFGGLARHPEATPDGFAMVVCHELGHHLAGAPRYGGMDWASTEGQSDYFATMKCMRRVLKNVDNWEGLRRLYTANDIDPLVAERCKAGHGESKQEFAICVRGAMGGKALARLLGDLGGNSNVNFDTPDTTVVRTTKEGHPEAQCRLDTYFAGAVCPVSADLDFDQNNPDVGACVEGSTAGVRRSQSRESRIAQVLNTLGARPRCWFKQPTSKSKMNPLASAY